MFRTLLERGIRMRYRPEMAVLHAVESWRLTRAYFIKLHYRAGLRHGQFRLPDYPRTLFGIPPFLYVQCLKQVGRTLVVALAGRHGLVRQAMNAANAMGMAIGYARKSRRHTSSS
jgi:hypothetical protein